MSENMTRTTTTAAATTTTETQPHDGGRITYFHGQGSLDELDEETLLKQSPFPIKPDDLIALTKHVLNDNLLCPEAHLKSGPALSEDFQYWSFAVGPINIKKFSYVFENEFDRCVSGSENEYVGVSSRSDGI